MIQPKIINSIIHYPIMEHFYSLQGEGVYAGQAAYFIRFAGCDVGCSWCDVKESWDVEERQFLALQQLVDEVNKTQAEIIVITGGEPAMYDLTEITNALKKENRRIHIETSGAYIISGNFDWICVSPKRFKKPLESSLIRADELKMIVVNHQDLKWAEELVALCSNECRLLIQPEWDRAEKVFPMINTFIKKNQKWSLSLQIHKYLNIP
jgi:organic radical activating enzyme